MKNEYNIQHSEKKRVPKRCSWATIATNGKIGTLFSLIIMCMEKRVPPQDRDTIHKNGRSTIHPISTLFHKSDTILVPFLPDGYCFEAKKG